MDGVEEPELEVEPEVPPLLPDDGLPEVPVSPVPDELALLELGDDDVPGAALPEAFNDVDELELPGVVDAVLPGDVLSLLLDVLDEGDVLAVLEGEVVDELDDVEPLPACLSQPVTAAPARARTATTGMSFFMNFSN